MPSQFDLEYYAPGDVEKKTTPVASFPANGGGGLPLSLAATNLTSALHGELPPDVQNLLAQRAAELGISSGTSGSEFNKFRSLRDLGLTSLDRQDAATKMLIPNFMTQYQAGNLALENRRLSDSENEAYQNRVARSRGNPLSAETSAPLFQPRANPNSTPNPTAWRNPAGSGSDVNSIIAELGQKYGPGRGGMAPMGSGTIPGGGGSWNAGPLDTGQGTFFAGDPSEMSTYDLGALGFPDFGDQSMLAGLSDDEYFDLAGLPLPAPQQTASNPITADDYDYLNGTG